MNSHWSLQWGGNTAEQITTVDAPSLSVNDLEFLLRRKRIVATRLNLALLQLLEQRHRPLSVPRLVELLRANFPRVNKTTVYRQLYKLAESCIVTEIHVGKNQQFYELTGDNSHHHLACRRCQRVQCVLATQLAPQLQQLDSELSDAQGWACVRHTLTFTGICPDCND